VKDHYSKKYTEPAQGSEGDGQKGQEGINRERSCKGRRGSQDLKTLYSKQTYSKYDEN